MYLQDFDYEIEHALSTVSLYVKQKIPPPLFVFRISPKTSGKQIVVYHSNVKVATWPVLPRKQATICFEELFPRTTLNLAGLRRLTGGFLFFFFWALKRLFIPVHTSLFWAIVKFCGIQWEDTFLTARCSCTIEWMLVEKIPTNACLTACHRCH